MSIETIWWMSASTYKDLFLIVQNTIGLLTKFLKFLSMEIILQDTKLRNRMNECY